MTKTLISFGHGYCAAALAQRLLPQGWAIFGTTRSPDKAKAIRATGVVPLVLGADDGQIARTLANATHMLVSAGPDAQGDPTLRQFGPQIGAVSHLEWAGYLSTTGVYGDHQGGWVDENTALTPSTQRGKWRVAAEREWQSLDLPLHIFRLAGIYGPGRGPFAKVCNGTARRIIKENQLFSRIHVADIAQTLHASLRRPNPGAIYNLCDNEAAPPEDVIAYAAELLDFPVPPEIPIEKADMTPMARSFYAESKRVRNDRIKNELDVVLQFPDYRTGLRALLDQEKT
ncbi:SDR family oxidoreductase [Thalassobius sp. S69A]|uniref:SDR family oxidoreductase n=1 Tax=unclassified Thalassovita TaxID=2619711 RepID=UPI000C0D0F8B|nr:NAD(P)-dependent oxidoreductase [Paracoccaceae bacterium]MBT26716.1 NAD(P)-dependent oxidoreductase [Paracoccaceae bacterium]